MDGFDPVDENADSDMIWACQSTALDHYEKHPTSNNIQENVFESSLKRVSEATTNSKERPWSLEDSWNSSANIGMNYEKLIDVDTPTLSMLDGLDGEDDAKDEHIYRLLLRNVNGKKITLVVDETTKYLPTEWKLLIEEGEHVIAKGSFVRELDERLDKDTIINYLNNTSRGWGIPVVSMDTKDAYGFIPEVYLVKLTIDDINVLRPSGSEDRFQLYQDFARLAFVKNIKEGAEVEFKEGKSDRMHRGFISSKDRDDRGDFTYAVRTPRGFSPPRERRVGTERGNPYRFYDDYEGNEHEGSKIYRVTADRLFPPSRRVEMTMGRDRRRTPSPPGSSLIPVRVLDSPPGYDFVSDSDVEHNREGTYRNLSGEWNRYDEDKDPVRPRPTTYSAPREKIIPIRILESPPWNAVGGAKKIDDSRQESYCNLHETEEGKRPPPKPKPRTIYDLPAPPNLPNFIDSVKQQTDIPERPNLPSFLDSVPSKKDPWGGEGRTKVRDKDPWGREGRAKVKDKDPWGEEGRTKVKDKDPWGREGRANGKEKDPWSGEGRTKGTENYLRYVEEEEQRMIQKQSGMNGVRREEERKERRENTTSTVRLGEWGDWREGDRCLWENDGKMNEATVRWIGRLRGHHSVYAGVQFDAPVGQGTGMYQGTELFNTPADHAGFVMLSTVSHLLISTSSNPQPDSFPTHIQKRERPRENGGRREGSSCAFDHISYPVEAEVRNASPPRDVPISGQGAMIPPRYKESEFAPSTSGVSSTSSSRNRALPPPPSYDADKPVPIRPPPPSLPPRPAMLPEDYMIESFDVGSCVDVCYKGAVRSGVVRWKGDAFNEELERLETSVVVELETSEAPPEGWKQSMETGMTGVDHTLSTVIVPISAVRRDRRFARDSSPLMGNGSNGNGYGEGMRAQDFGSIDSGVETSKRDPWGGTDELIGRMKGIQGNRNSCYLDSMLYTLFVQCSSFDDILTRRRGEVDIREYDELVRILSTEIVWPLRRFHYVRADHMMKFRRELEKALPNIKGLTSEEKDPEEILSSLFRDIFKTKPYLKLINSKTGQVESTWLYHVVVDAGEWQSNIASSQHLLERSLRKDSTKFAECPQVFIMQLPRYGVTKLFDKIVPLEKIDLTPFINNTVFGCAHCQKNAAELYCHECFLTKEALYGEVSYCVECFRMVHLKEGLGDHADRPIPPPSRPTKKMTRYTFTLSGVLAIETSHYVSFVRSSHGRWLFFDSMADREGLQNGFNIPQVRECERVGSWLSLNGYDRLHSPLSIPAPIDDPLVNRLLSDPYICIYTADQPTVTSSNSTTSLLSKLTKELKISRN